MDYLNMISIFKKMESWSLPFVNPYKLMFKVLLYSLIWLTIIF